MDHATNLNSKGPCEKNGSKLHLFEFTMFNSETELLSLI